MNVKVFTGYVCLCIAGCTSGAIDSHDLTKVSEINEEYVEFVVGGDCKKLSDKAKWNGLERESLEVVRKSPCTVRSSWPKIRPNTSVVEIVLNEQILVFEVDDRYVVDNSEFWPKIQKLHTQKNSYELLLSMPFSSNAEWADTVFGSASTDELVTFCSIGLDIPRECSLQETVVFPEESTHEVVDFTVRYKGEYATTRFHLYRDWPKQTQLLNEVRVQVSNTNSSLVLRIEGVDEQNEEIAGLLFLVSYGGRSTEEVYAWDERFVELSYPLARFGIPVQIMVRSGALQNKISYTPDLLSTLSLMDCAKAISIQDLVANQVDGVSANLVVDKGGREFAPVSIQDGNRIGLCAKVVRADPTYDLDLVIEHDVAFSVYPECLNATNSCDKVSIFYDYYGDGLSSAVVEVTH